MLIHRSQMGLGLQRQSLYGPATILTNHVRLVLYKGPRPSSDISKRPTGRWLFWPLDPLLFSPQINNTYQRKYNLKLFFL